MFYTIEETVEALKSGKTTSEDLVRSSIDTFEKDKKSEKPLNAFLEVYSDVLEKAKLADDILTTKETFISNLSKDEIMELFS